jgi:hypothetical protein
MRNALNGATTPSEWAEKLSVLVNNGLYARKLFLIRSLCDAYVMRSRFFRAMLCHTKVELSKIDLYYTRALEAKQNSSFSLNFKKLARR